MQTETRTAGKIETVAKAIAEHLEGWQAVESAHGNGWWDLIPIDPRPLSEPEPHMKAARLHVRRQQNDPGRITITGAGPTGWTKLYLDETNQAGLRAKATAAIDRDPAAIARDVQRKVLPSYLPALAHVVRRLAEERDAAARREETAAALARDYEGMTTAHSPTGTVYLRSEYVNRVEVNHDGTEARIEPYSLPIELARKVLDLLTEPGTQETVPPSS